MQDRTGAISDPGQGDVVQGAQDQLSGRALIFSSGLAGIKATQDLAGLLQGLSHLELQQGQGSQGQHQKADQAFDALIGAQVDGRERQRFSFQPCEAVLDTILGAIGHDRLLYRELILGLIGGINPPAQLGYSVLACLFIDGGLNLAALFDTHLGGSIPVATDGSFGARSAIAHIDQFGHPIGCAFQIKDDILDVEGDTETIGKPAGSDESLDKATYPALFGVDASKRRCDELLDDALANLVQFGQDATPLAWLARFVVEQFVASSAVAGLCDR